MKKNEGQGNVTEGFELQIDASELLILMLRLDIRTFILKALKCVHGTLQQGWGGVPGHTGTGPAGKVVAPGMSFLSLFYSAVRAVYIKLVMRIYRKFYLIEILWWSSSRGEDAQTIKAVKQHKGGNQSEGYSLFTFPGFPLNCWCSPEHLCFQDLKCSITISSNFFNFGWL